MCKCAWCRWSKFMKKKGRNPSKKEFGSRISFKEQLEDAGQRSNSKQGRESTSPW